MLAPLRAQQRLLLLCIARVAVLAQEAQQLLPLVLQALAAGMSMTSGARLSHWLLDYPFAPVILMLGTNWVLQWRAEVAAWLAPL